MRKKGNIGSYLALFLIIGLLLLFGYGAYAFTGYGNATNGNWSNITWHYRVRIEVNSSVINRTNWPVEISLNFSDLYPSGTFDINSTRVFEYSSGGTLLREVSSQLDPDDGYSAASNAVGTVVFVMNGTTQTNTTRIFYIYYDITQHGSKPSPSYATALNFTWDGRNANLSNRLVNISIDTNRLDNTSGIARVIENQFQNVILQASSSARTAEYLQYFNGTHNTSFNLVGNASFVNGPIRVTLVQEGPEIMFGNLSSNTTQGRIVKKYYIYNLSGPELQGTFVKISSKFVNTGGTSIQRNSTPVGALAVDAGRTLSSGSIDTFDFNSTDPYSYAWASGVGGEIVGIINLNETITQFFANFSSPLGRIGIQLDNTTIGAGNSIEHTAIMYLGTGGSDAVTEFFNIRNGFSSQLVITQFLPEVLVVEVKPVISPSTYNRNETILIRSNFSSGDPYNLTKYVNVTVDNGTQSSTDDIILQLLDDGTSGDVTAGDRIFSRNFTLQTNANVTEWSVNITAFDANNQTLNFSTGKFNVTDVLNVTISMPNPVGLVSRLVLANATVSNFRKDTFLPFSTVACSFGSTVVTNITNMNNGNYSINFTAPSSTGTFILQCNATWASNFGNVTDSFVTETDKINVTVDVTPRFVNITNITLSNNETFSIFVNLTNIGNGTARGTNITFQLPFAWSVSPINDTCGDINLSSSCTKQFNITVPNATLPGNYSYNVTATWSNPDTMIAANFTIGNVTVFSKPVLNVSESNITTIAPDGTTSTIGAFTVQSLGNDDVRNINFTCFTGVVCQNFALVFSPQNITNITQGNVVVVSVNLTVPLNFTPGSYNGTVNVSSTSSSANDIINIFIVLQSSTNLSMNFSLGSYTATNITLQTSDAFTVDVNLTNGGNASARNPNVSLVMPSGWSYLPPANFCSNLTKSQSCINNFNVTIPNATSAGNYTVNATAFWINPDNSIGNRNITLNVTVVSNPFITLSVSSMTSNASDGTNVTIGNFTIFSIGSDTARNITFACTSGIVCSNFTPSFSPQNISNITVGSNSTVSVNVSVPSGFAAGTYNGTVNVSSTSNFQLLQLFVTVLPNRVWNMTPTSCIRSQNPDVGTVCNVVIVNTGNDLINFTISPVSANQTSVNETNFTISMGANHTFSVLYNVTGAPQVQYNTTYTVLANQTASPQSLLLNITLLPFTPPIINVSLNATSIDQNSSIEVRANITDRSNLGLSFARINVTLPNGTLFSANMTLLNVSGNFSQWRYVFPNSTLNQTSVLKGTYNVTVYAEDVIGNQGNFNASFIAVAKLSVTSATLSSNYFQGDTGSIFYVARDLNGAGIGNVSVLMRITDPNGNLTFTQAGTTTNEGLLSPLPTFSIASDAIVGNYTLLTNSTFFDSAANITVNKSVNYTFQVSAKTVTVAGLFADIETAVVWFPNNVMRFNLLVYDGQGTPVDPTSVNFTVYDPAGNVYFVVNLSQMTRQQTGLYSYQFAMPSNTATGMYLAIADVKQSTFQTLKLKAFRVASGGPYDVRVQLLESDVPQGDTLDFLLFVENKGEVSQDVFLEYTVKSTGGQTYYTASEAVFSPAFANQSFNRNVFIFSSQPIGTYVLSVKMTFDSVQPSVISNASFVVTSPATPPSQPPPGGTTTPPTTGSVTETEERPPQQSILISRYTDNISLARGASRIEYVTVINTGRVAARNLTLVILGIPANWYNVTPSSYQTLSPGNLTVFLIDFDLPVDAEVGTKQANILATTGTVSDQKSLTVNVYKSVEELLDVEIDNVKRDYNKLLVEIKIAENNGKDVSKIRVIADDIDTRIKSAREKFNNKDYEGVYDDVDTARSLIKKAYDLLNSLAVTEVQVIPLWIIVLLVMMASGTGLSLAYAKKKHIPIHIPKLPVGISKISLKRQSKLGAKNVPLDKNKDERDRLQRMLSVLEKEKSEGILTPHAYEEMRKSIEAKLRRLSSS